MNEYTHTVGDRVLELKQVGEEHHLFLNGQQIGRIYYEPNSLSILMFDDLQGNKGSRPTRYSCANAILYSRGLGGTPSDDLYVSSMNYPH